MKSAHSCNEMEGFGDFGKIKGRAKVAHIRRDMVGYRASISDERSEEAERALLASYPGPKYTPCASNGVAPQALREHEAAQRPNQRFTSSSELCSRVTLGPKYTPCASNRARSSVLYWRSQYAGHPLVVY